MKLWLQTYRENRYEFLQPIQMRFNELISGVRAELAIKVFGDDFDQLISLGAAVENRTGKSPGAADVSVEQATGLPIMTILPRREAMARLGLSVAQLQEILAAALGGRVASQLYEGDRRSDIVVRLAEHLRTDMDGLSSLPVMLANGDYIPLGEVAELTLVTGYNQIYRGKRQATHCRYCQCPWP